MTETNEGQTFEFNEEVQITRGIEIKPFFSEVTAARLNYTKFIGVSYVVQANNVWISLYRITVLTEVEDASNHYPFYAFGTNANFRIYDSSFDGSKV